MSDSAPGLLGPYGGPLVVTERDARETVAPALAERLVLEGGGAPAHPSLVPIFGFVPAREVVLVGDLRDLAPLAPGADLGPLRVVLGALEELHGRGRVHGDLRPEHVWTGARTVLTHPAGETDAPGLLRTRLREGAPPATVAFSAPEVVAGGPATRASDVFAFAALVHWHATGRPPAGRVASEALGSLNPALRALVLRALDPDPARRPALVAFASALEVAPATREVDAARTGALAAPRRRRWLGPRRARKPATEEPARAPEPVEARPVLEATPAAPVVAVAKVEEPILMAGAAIVEAAPVVEAPPVARAVGPGEVLAAARATPATPPEAAPVAATVPAAAAPASTTPSVRVRLVTTPEGATAATAEKERRETPVILNLLLLLGGTFTLVGAFWLVVKGFQTLGERGPFVLLSVLTAGFGVAGTVLEKRDFPRSGFGLTVLATQLLWAVGAYGLLLSDNLAPGPWAVVAGLVGGATFATAIWKRSALLSVLGLFGVAGALLLLGYVLRTGKPEGAALWTLLCGGVVGAIAVVGHRTAGDRVALPPAIGATLFGLASGFAALSVFHAPELRTFSIGWPYLVAAIAGGVALALRAEQVVAYRGCALATLVPVLVATPVFHAFTPAGAPPLYAWGATVLGAALVAAALLVRELEARPGAATLASAVGLAHVAASRSPTTFTGVLAAATFGLAIRRRSSGLSFVGAALAATATVLANRAWCFDSLPQGATWAGVVALVLGALAVLGGARAGDPVARPPFGLALVAVLASFFLALAASSSRVPFAVEPGTFAIAWPYLLAVATGGAALAARGEPLRAYRGGLHVTLLVVLGATPLFHAFANESAPPGYGHAAAAAGALVAALALLWPRLARDAGLQAVLVAVGVAHVAAAKSGALTWSALALATYGLALRHRASPLSLVAGVSASVATWLIGRPFWDSAPEAPAELGLALAAVLATGAGFARRRADESVAAPLVVLAVLAHLASLALALETARRPGLVAFSIAWPYGLAGLATLLALVLHAKRVPVHRDAAFVAAAVPLAVAPLFHAHSGASPNVPAAYLHGAATSGALLVLGAFFVPGIRASAFHQGVFLAVGVANAAAARSWSAFASALAASAFGLAVRARSLELGSLASALAGTALVLLGRDLDLAGPEPRAEFALAAAGLVAALGLVGAWRASRPREDAPPFAHALGAPFTVLANLALVASAGFAFERLRDAHALAFALGWPYLVAAVALAATLALAWRVPAREYARGTSLTLALVLSVTPLAHAFGNPHVPREYLLGVAAAGTALVLAAMTVERLVRDPWIRALAIVVGLANAQAARSASLTTGVLAASAYSLAIGRRSQGLAWLASVLGVASLVLLGGKLWTSSPEAPAIGLLGCALVLALVAVVGRLRSGGDEAALPPAITAVALLLGSWLASLGTLLRPELFWFSATWPYVLVAVSGGAAVALGRRDLRPWSSIAASGALVVLLPTPGIHALVHRDTPAFLYLASVVGTLLLIAAFKWSDAVRGARPQALSIAAGLANVALPPAVLALANLATRDADALFAGLLSGGSTPPEMVQNPLFYLSYVVVTSGVLVGLAQLFARESDRKAPYRALELAGLVLFFGTLSVLSLLRYREYLHAAVLFGGGFALIALGAVRRHLLLVAVSTPVLILNLWFQYFVKLWNKVHLGWLSIGFGVGILVGAILFERAVRPRLARLREWA